MPPNLDNFSKFYISATFLALIVYIFRQFWNSVKILYFSGEILLWQFVGRLLLKHLWAFLNLTFWLLWFTTQVIFVHLSALLSLVLPFLLTPLSLVQCLSGGHNNNNSKNMMQLSGGQFWKCFALNLESIKWIE